MAGRSFLKNFAFVSAAEVITKIAGAIIVFYLARILEPAGFGLVNYAAAIVIYFQLLVLMGLDTVGARRIARDKEHAALEFEVDLIKVR